MMKEKRSIYPFTTSQWQELEHQVLIYKYMVSGLPIPSDLILPIRRSILFDSNKASPSLSFSPQTQLEWCCVHMGIGREAEDPELERCRRTDGKKWRCSKEAYPDSKYCERHMHRGKNRSRKHAEIYPTTDTNTYSSSTSTHHPHPANLSISTPDTYDFLNPNSSTTRPPGSHFSTTSRTSNLQRNTASFSNRDYGYGQRIKHLDEYSIFSNSSGAERENPLQLKPLRMSSLIEATQRSYSLFKEEEKERQRHASGAVKLKPQRMSSLIEANQRSYSLSKEEEEERQRPLHHFFNEWPQKNKESWMELEENASYTKTQLNISVQNGFSLPTD